MTSILLARYRGEWEESRHSGALAVFAQGERPVFSLGDIDRPVFPRSSIKPIHAVPFFASGAADALGCTAYERALSAASHAAEPAHLEALASWAERLGLVVADLVCGRDAPLGRHSGGQAGKADAPWTAFHNNNAGKHLALLSTSRHLGEDISGYGRPDHPAMRRLVATTEAFCAVRASALPQAIENCGLPTFAMPLSALARGMAQFATSDQTLAIRQALAAEPEAFAGSRRLGTRLLRASAGMVIAKGGSEGVFAVADCRQGLGFALKIDDGSGEAAALVILEALARFGSLPLDVVDSLSRELPQFRNAYHPERGPCFRFPSLPSDFPA